MSPDPSVKNALPDAFATNMKAVPNKPGNFIIASQAYVHGKLPGSGSLYLTQNCGISVSSAISGIESVIAWGIGAANPNDDGMPALYCQCYSKTGPTFGFFEIDNYDSTPIVTNIDSAQGGYPANSLDFLEFIAGDVSTYGTIYGRFGGSGGFRRT